MEKTVIKINGEIRDAILIPVGLTVDNINSTDTEIKLVTDLRVNNNPSIVKVYSYSKDELLDYKTTVKEAFVSGDMSSTKDIANHVKAINQISLILKYDVHFGGLITDDEWRNNKPKYSIKKSCDNNGVYYKNEIWNSKTFLAFHTIEQANLFIAEYKDLVDLYYSF